MIVRNAKHCIRSYRLSMKSETVAPQFELLIRRGWLPTQGGKIVVEQDTGLRT